MKLVKPRWRKVIRDIWSYKFRTVLVVLSIAVGIFAIGVVSGARQIFLTAVTRSYSATNPTSGIVMMVDDIDDDMVTTIESMDEVESAEGQREITLRYKLAPTDEWSQLTLKAVDNFDEMKIAIIQPQAGTWPPPDKKLVIERAALGIMGAKIGDPVIVETDGGKEKVMEIAGTAHDQSSPPASVSRQVSVFINRDTLEWLGEPRDYNRLYYIVAEHKTDKNHVEDVGNLIRNKLEKNGYEVTIVQILNPGEHPLNAVLGPLMLILEALGILALFLSGFLVINILSAILAQQTKQIGIMKAIGARRSQIMTLYFVMVLVYGLMALVLAVPLGIAGAWGLSVFMANFFNVDLGEFSFPISVLATQIAIGIFIPLGVAVYPIINGTRITVREAISEYGLGKGQFGTSLLDRILQSIRGLSRPLMISLRNTFRRKVRLTFTLVTLTLAGATFITIFSVRASMLTTLDDMLSYWNYDIAIEFDRDYRLTQIERAVAKMPDVTAAEAWGAGSAIFVRPDGREGSSAPITAPSADTEMLDLELVEGRWLQPDDTNALVIDTEFLADEPDLKVGDDIRLKIGGRKSDWKIVGIVQGSMMGSNVYANYPYFARKTNNVDKSRSVRLTTSLPPERLNDKQVLQSFEQQFKEAGLNVSTVRTVQETRSMVETMVTFLISFLLVMAVLLAVVGGLGMSGTMSINVLERVREIGVMRSIGASNWAILKLVIIEGLIIGLIGWLIGTVLAVPLSKVISDQVGMLMFSRDLTFSFSVSGTMLWLVLSSLLAAFASFLPARNASQLTVREVLAYE
jgi:putative ABC transport system permease protein